jgi:hypothetical protein
MSRSSVPTDKDWRSVADELAGALRTTVLRNPNLNATDWDRARAALDRYERADSAASEVDLVDALGEGPQNP